MEQDKKALDLLEKILDSNEEQRDQILAGIDPAVADHVRRMLISDRKLDQNSLPPLRQPRWAARPSRPPRDPWFWRLVGIDLVVAFFYAFFIVAVALNHTLVQDSGGPLRLAVYAAVSLAFTATAACLGGLKPEIPEARLGYAALMAEGLCLLSVCLRSSQGTFHGLSLVAFNLLTLSDGLNFPIFYHYYLTDFQKRLHHAKGRRFLLPLYVWAIGSVLFRLAYYTNLIGDIDPIGDLWFDIFYIGAPLLLSAMIFTNYRRMLERPADLRQTRWFMRSSVLAISSYGLARFVELLLKISGWKNLDGQKGYKEVEILVVLFILFIATASAEGIIRKEWFDTKINRNSVFNTLSLLAVLGVAISLHQIKQKNEFAFIGLLATLFCLVATHSKTKRWFTSGSDCTTYVCRRCGTCHGMDDKTCVRCNRTKLEKVYVPRIFDNGKHAYLLEQRIGSGKKGTTVYKAWDIHNRSHVAVKVTRIETADQFSRSEREAQLLREMNHPNVVAIYDLIQKNGLGFTVMEFADGPTLRDKFNQEKCLAVEDVAELFPQIFDAVAALNAKRIAHCDVKPENFVITSGPYGRPMVKLVDLDIAKQRHPAARCLTETLSRGTLLYASPEQWNNEEVDERTDIFSLGIVLFEALTGHVPYKGNTRQEQGRAAERHQLSFDRSLGLDPRLVAALRKSLEKAPEDRFQSAAAFKQEVIPLLSQVRSAIP